MRTYPKTTSNKNVPKGVFLIAETSAMSGEIITTYYANTNGDLLKVEDWKGSKPSSVHLFEVCRLTGDTEFMLLSRWKSFKAQRGLE